jgi:hypothetical protein
VGGQRGAPASACLEVQTQTTGLDDLTKRASLGVGARTKERSTTPIVAELRGPSRPVSDHETLCAVRRPDVGGGAGAAGGVSMEGGSSGSPRSRAPVHPPSPVVSPVRSREGRDSGVESTGEKKMIHDCVGMVNDILHDGQSLIEAGKSLLMKKEVAGLRTAVESQRATYQKILDIIAMYEHRYRHRHIEFRTPEDYYDGEEDDDGYASHSGHHHPHSHHKRCPSLESSMRSTTTTDGEYVVRQHTHTFPSPHTDSGSLVIRDRPRRKRGGGVERGGRGRDLAGRHG